ncbi:MAG: L,D-transpeptidase, partial [Bdellovibrionales bacterium]|nr:L,D-transpeptidase [Bdellovibrionales bacterium]
QNAEAREAFSRQIDQDPSLSVEVKKAYKVLVNPEGGRHNGDSVHELIDEQTLRWFYGEDFADKDDGIQVLNGPEKLYKTALVGEANVRECLRHRLCVHVRKGRQRMTAYERGKPMVFEMGGKRYLFKDIKVSTARAGKVTPTGLFTVGEIADETRTSGLYKDAALYYAMNVVGDVFIHATSTNNYSKLGSPASAGCIRTTLEYAGILNEKMRSLNSRRLRNEPFFINGADIRVVITKD